MPRLDWKTSRAEAARLLAIAILALWLGARPALAQDAGAVDYLLT